MFKKLEVSKILLYTVYNLFGANYSDLTAGWSPQMVAKSALNSGLGTIGQFSPHLSTVQWCWKSGSIWSLHVFQVVSNIFMFMPIWGRFPFGLFRWVETNQCFFPQSREPFRVSEAEHLGPLPFKCFNVFDTINCAKKERFVFSYTYIYTI